MKATIAPACDAAHIRSAQKLVRCPVHPVPGAYPGRESGRGPPATSWGTMPAEMNEFDEHWAPQCSSGAAHQKGGDPASLSDQGAPARSSQPLLQRLGSLPHLRAALSRTSAPPSVLAVLLSRPSIVASVWWLLRARACGRQSPCGPRVVSIGGSKLIRWLASVLLCMGMLVPAHGMTVTGPCVIPERNNCVESSAYNGGTNIAGGSGGYSSNEDCEISGFRSDAIVVNNFDVEDHPSCNYDYLARPPPLARAAASASPRLTACATAMRINGAKRGAAHVALSSSEVFTP